MHSPAEDFEAITGLQRPQFDFKKSLKITLNKLIKKELEKKINFIFPERGTGHEFRGTGTGTEQIFEIFTEQARNTEHEFRGTRNGTEQIFEISAERGTGTEQILKISAERGTGTEHTGQNCADPC